MITRRTDPNNGAVRHLRRSYGGGAFLLPQVKQPDAEFLSVLITVVLSTSVYSLIISALLRVDKWCKL